MNETKSKPKPRIGLFLAQPQGTLVGRGKPFADTGELCRHAAGVWGYECATAPIGFIDMNLALKDAGYVAQTLAQFQDWGTPLTRFEIHTIGQRMLIHPAQLDRFKGFSDPLKMTGTSQWGTHRKHEDMAETEQLQAIYTSRAFGFTSIVNFSGNRGWTTAKYPWSAYPAHLRLWIVILLYLKHRGSLRLCAEFGITMAFELHPENDLCSPYMLYLFREVARVIDGDFVAETIIANGDASHETLAGGNAAEHFKFMEKHGLLGGVFHLKDAEVMLKVPGAIEVNPFLQGMSVFGDFAPRWSDSARRFATFGCGQADWSVIGPIILRNLELYGADLIVEGECSIYPDMMQGLEIGAENARRLRDGKPFLRWDERIPKESTMGNWEDFCTNPGVTPAALLAVNQDEQAKIEAFIEILEAKVPEFLKVHF